MDINIGDLTTRISFQAQTRAADGMGGFAVTWADLGTVWAKAWTVSTMDLMTAGQTGMVRTQKFAIRHRGLVRPSWRIKWSTVSGLRYFAIVGIEADPRNTFLFITCKEVG